MVVSKKKNKNKPSKKVSKKTKRKTIVSKKRVVKKVNRKVIKIKKAVKGVGKKLTALNLHKPSNNPIIKPISHVSWQSKAAFNPTAIHHDGKIHIIYRAIGDSDESVLGYANSRDGITINLRHPSVAYHHNKKNLVDKSRPNISYSSGGGWGGGCEDPRLTLIDERAYLLYTAFDGWGSVRIALNSISLDDFISNRWNWRKPVLISPPGEIHKNWVLFPEKIKGKYAILHGLSPEILIDYFNSLDELDGDKFIQSIHQGSPLWYRRSKGIRGVGPAPIKTKYGWLVLYHAMDKINSNQYKLWAMLLDLNNPTKILYRGVEPILEPDEDYENYGFKSGVVYSCGAVVKDGTLFVYYGGADMVSCVATANLDKFLKELIKSKPSKLAKTKSKLKVR